MFGGGRKSTILLGTLWDSIERREVLFERLMVSLLSSVCK